MMNASIKLLIIIEVNAIALLGRVFMLAPSFIKAVLTAGLVLI